jgi:hypothetical protein
VKYPGFEFRFDQVHGKYVRQTEGKRKQLTTLSCFKFNTLEMGDNLEMNWKRKLEELDSIYSRDTSRRFETDKKATIKNKRLGAITRSKIVDEISIEVLDEIKREEELKKSLLKEEKLKEDRRKEKVEKREERLREKLRKAEAEKEELEEQIKKGTKHLPTSVPNSNTKGKKIANPNIIKTGKEKDKLMKECTQKKIQYEELILDLHEQIQELNSSFSSSLLSSDSLFSQDNINKEVSIYVCMYVCMFLLFIYL